MAKIERITIVLANWCPHCVPLSSEYSKKMAMDMGVPLRVLDIDIAKQELTADRIIEKYGDYVEDYIIPQVFLEYKGGEVEHLFTGFSEGVVATEAKWLNLFNSKFYQCLLKRQKEDDDFLIGLIKRHLAFNVQCRGHCNALTTFKTLQTGQCGVVGAYCCPGKFVSRIIYYSFEPDLECFYTFLSDQLGREMVEKRDLRVASRHRWELEKSTTELESLSLKQHKLDIIEVYWTRYPKNDLEKKKGVFLCSSCGKLFSQEITSKNRLCLKCR